MIHKHQVHEEFKMFTAGPDSLSELSAQVYEFVRQAGVAVKSLSVISNEKVSVISIGYSSAEPSYPILISASNLLCSDAAKIEEYFDDALNESGCLDKDVICHSIYVNEFGDFFVAFLYHA